MEFFIFIVCVVLVVSLSKSRKEIKELRNQVNFLDSKIRDLYDKAYYNYEQIKQLKNSDVTENNNAPDSVQPPVNVSDSPPVPSQNVPDKLFNPYQKLENIPTIFKDDVRENVPVVSMSTSPENVSQVNGSPIHSDSGQPVNAPVAASVPIRQNPETPSAITSVIKNNVKNVHASSSDNVIPHTPNVSHEQKKKSSEPPQLKSFENWLGTRLFNVVASLMIFIGLVLFCTLGYEYITDTMKMAAMFVVSGAFIGLGAFFTRQNKSVFSLGLTGCGFGSFFISILLSHIYFHVLTDVAAFGLLLVWAIFALFMSKKLDSVMLSVTAHMGTAVSICFAFSLGFSAEKIILPVVYQIAAIAVIIIGNIFCCKKTYRFGLFMSEILMIYTSIVMCVTFSDISVMPDVVSPVFTIIIFTVQFMAISFISYLITISTAALETEKPNLNNLNDIIFFAHISNKIFWISGIVTSVGFVIYFIFKNAYGIDSVVYPTLAVCTAVVGHILVTLFMSEKLNFNEKLSKISIWFNSIVVMISLFIQAASRDILKGMPFLFVYIGFVMIVIRYTKNKKLNHLVAFLIGCEMVYMAFYGYFAAANVVLSIVYMFIVGVEILLHWFMQSGESRERRFTFFKMSEYLWLSVSVIPINISEFSDISFPLILSEFALINIIAYVLKYGRDNEPELRLTVKIESLGTIYTSIFALAFNASGALGDILAIKIAFIILSAGLTALYIREFVTSKSTALQVTAAATISGFITVFFIGFADSWTLAEIYTYVLQCKPMFLIAAIALVLIYRYNRNHELQVFIWAVLGIDAFLMLFWGYGELIYEFRNNTPAYVISVSVCAVHAVINALIFYFSWKIQNEEQRRSTLTVMKMIEYFWMNMSAFAICSEITDKFLPSECAFAVLTLINVVLFILEYHKSSKVLDITVKIVSSVVLYISVIFMTEKIRVPQSPVVSRFVAVYTIRVALILLTVALYYLISREILKSRSVFIQAYVGFTATCIVNAACSGLSNIFEIAYIFSIVTMITSLICIAVGFAANTKGLRVYGLMVVMLCVIKLVTFDIGTTNADSLSRVAAFVIGGIVCFVISGIYNKFESKFLNDNKEQIIVEQNK